MMTKTVLCARTAFITVFIVSAGVSFGQADKDALSRDRLGQGDKITIGETAEIHSNILDEDRNLLIYQPDDSASSQIEYPVIYLPGERKADKA